MVHRFGHCLLAPFRTRGRALVTLVTLTLLALAGWQGLGLYRFYRDRAAAREALADYDFPEASRRLAACLGRRPRDPELLLLAAQAARRDGLLDDAEDLLDRYREQVGKSTPEGAMQGALVQVQRGKVKEYVGAMLEHLEVRHPQSEQILEALAQGSVHVYRLDEASFWTKQLLDRFPHNPIGRLLHAQTLDTLRKRDRARELARTLVEDYPHFDKGRQFLAGLLFKSHLYAEAATQYQELHRRQPRAVMPLLGLSRCLVTLGRVDEARPLFDQLAADHADNADALLECARFALRQKRPGDAEGLLRDALKLAPFDHEVHQELAVSLSQLGRADEARRHLDRHHQILADLKRLDEVFQAMVKKPNDPAPRLEAGQICLRNGQASEGLRWLLGILDLHPDHKPTHLALADHYAATGDAVRANFHRAKAQ